MLRGSAVPPRRLGVVLGNALAFGVHVPEIELSPGVASLGVNPEPSKGRGMVTSLVCCSGFLHGLRRSGRRAHDRQQQCRGQGEQSTRPVRRAHDSSAPFKSHQPVDLLFAWHMNAHARSAPLLRHPPRCGPIMVPHRYRAEVPSGTDQPETGRSNHSSLCPTSRGTPRPTSYKTPSMVRAPVCCIAGTGFMSTATKATQGFATCRRSWLTVMPMW